MAACGLAPLRNSSRTRSLISTFESIAMPKARAIAAMPGSVKVACSMDSTATNNSKLTPSAMPENTPKRA
jgi:hypothetical protein